MSSPKWWYLISMTAVGLSMGIALYASTARILPLLVLALLSAAYWALAAFGSAGELRFIDADRYGPLVKTSPEDHIG